MSHSKLLAALACIFVFLLAATPLHAQSSDSKSKLDMVKGPAKARLQDIAQIDVPAGAVFLDGKATRALMKASGEPTSGREYGAIMTTNDDWVVIFEYSNIGYVKDDEKDSLNADKILDSIRKGTAAANKERVRAGHSPLEIVGWEVPPRYDATTHNLEWAIRATSEGQPILNYNTRLLGRKGVMEVVLVVEPAKLSATLPQFRNLLAGYAFQTGQTYAEFRAGDKIAKYGLGALIVGGAAVGAAKLGLFATLAVFFKKAWKLVVVAIVAVGAFMKKLFGRGDGTTRG
jgi:uncharacterized membrane-anchored protein